MLDMDNHQQSSMSNMLTAASSSSYLLLLLLFFLSMGISILGQHRQYSPSRPKSQQAAKSPPSSAANQQQPQFMTAPQCRCKDLNECAREIQKLVDKCKLTPKCEAHLAKIGNAAKIRQCLADEQKDMEKLEDCVEKKTGPIGCTNDPKPKNLTIPIIPEMMEDGGGGSGRSRQGRSVNTDWDFEDPDADIGGGSGPRTLRAAPPPLPATQEEGHAPPELSDYLMCVDQCAVQSASPNSAPKLCATRESNMDCAFRLKCALAPPDERQQKAFDECEKQLQLIPAKRVKKSCECLKSAGVKIVCPK